MDAVVCCVSVQVGSTLALLLLCAVRPVPSAHMSAGRAVHATAGEGVCRDRPCAQARRRLHHGLQQPHVPHQGATQPVCCGPAPATPGLQLTECTLQAVAAWVENSEYGRVRLVCQYYQAVQGEAAPPAAGDLCMLCALPTSSQLRDAARRLHAAGGGPEGAGAGGAGRAQAGRAGCAAGPAAGLCSTQRPHCTRSSPTRTNKPGQA